MLSCLVEVRSVLVKSACVAAKSTAVCHRSKTSLCFIVMHFSLWRKKVSEYRLMVAITEEKKISEKCHYQNITTVTRHQSVSSKIYCHSQILYVVSGEKKPLNADCIFILLYILFYFSVYMHAYAFSF